MDSTVNHTTNKRSKLKGGSVHESDEINDEKIDENLHKFNLQVELAMQIISSDNNVRSNTVQDLEDFNSQSLATQAEKG